MALIKEKKQEKSEKTRGLYKVRLFRIDNEIYEEMKRQKKEGFTTWNMFFRDKIIK